jgi:hypothetical protein
LHTEGGELGAPITDHVRLVLSIHLKVFCVVWAPFMLYSSRLGYVHPFSEAIDMEDLPRKKLNSQDEEGASRDDSLIDKLIYFYDCSSY